MVDQVELLPCPFCGGHANGPLFEYELGRWDIWQIECPDCTISIETPTGFWGEAAKQAIIERWNTRTPTTPERSDDEWPTA